MCAGNVSKCSTTELQPPACIFYSETGSHESAKSSPFSPVCSSEHSDIDYPSALASASGVGVQAYLEKVPPCNSSRTETLYPNPLDPIGCCGQEDRLRVYSQGSN